VGAEHVVDLTPPSSDEGSQLDQILDTFMSGYSPDPLVEDDQNILPELTTPKIPGSDGIQENKACDGMSPTCDVFDPTCFTFSQPEPTEPLPADSLTTKARLKAMNLLAPGTSSRPSNQHGIPDSKTLRLGQTLRLN